jgi:putative hydrolase of the HAD superfamily
MTDYDAVFWDVGGVLLSLPSVQAGHRAFVERFVERRSLDVDPEAAVETWRAAVGEHFREREGTEFRSAREGYQKGVDAVAGEPVPEPAWRPLFRETTLEYIEANDGARETVAALAEAGIYQGIVSDVDAEEGDEILEALGVREHVDDVTTSEAVGRTKPDDVMFETALGKSSHPPERTVMVGDRYEHDVAGAAAHGIAPVAFGAEDGPAVVHRAEQLRDVLAIVGVEG